MVYMYYKTTTASSEARSEASLRHRVGSIVRTNTKTYHQSIILSLTLTLTLTLQAPVTVKPNPSAMFITATARQRLPNTLCLQKTSHL